jgi:hypothetical protein
VKIGFSPLSLFPLRITANDMDLQRVLSCPTDSSANDNPQLRGFQNFLEELSTIALPLEPPLAQPVSSFPSTPSSLLPSLLPPPLSPFHSLPVTLPSNMYPPNSSGFPLGPQPQRRKSGVDIFPPSRNYRMDINSGLYTFRQLPPSVPSVGVTASSSSALLRMPNYPQFSLDRTASMPLPLPLTFQQDLEMGTDGEKVSLPSFQSLTQNLQLSPQSRPRSSELSEARTLSRLHLSSFRPKEIGISRNSQESEHMMVLEEQKEFLRQAKLKDETVGEGSAPMEISESDWTYRRPVSFQESYESSLGHYDADHDSQDDISKIERASSIPAGRMCRHSGCTKTAQTGGFCRPHGGGSRCKHTGCTKCAQKGGYCTRHGGGVRCGVKDCPKGAQVGGFCVAHGGGRRCKYSGCTKAAQKGSYCVTHGGAWRCKVEGCEKLDAGRGLCIRHGEASAALSCLLECLMVSLL